jgi:predicted dehydrogenase
MTRRFNRRTFAKRSAQAAAAVAAAGWLGAPYVLAEPSPNSKLHIAGIGVGGRGGSHVTSSLGENLVAVCDVAEGTLDSCLKRVEKAYHERNLDRPLPKRFFDYREMLDKLHDKIDAVFVATPDNHHAPASMLAIKLGKHVYCEKPLTHDIHEARQLTLAARQHNVATQLGNQGRAGEEWRLLCEWLWAGAIGDVKEVHVWTDRPGIPKRFWWPQGGTRPAGADAVPPGIHWDQWLGPAPERPYLDTYKEGKFKGKHVYQPFVWRGWWDFGTGALGDIGCHAMSGVFSALRIEHAAAVELLQDSGDATAEMFPSASTIRWEIPARAGMSPCQVFWYDGGRCPPRELGELAAGQNYPDNGAIVVGQRGKLTLYGGPRLLPEAKMKDFKRPQPLIPRCQSNHFDEWITACKGGRPAFSNFDHAGPLTEFVLLGNLAIRAGVGRKVQWDGPNLQCVNRPELNRFVKREYRAGWKL